MKNLILLLLNTLPMILASAPIWHNKGTCGKSKYPDAGDYFLPAPTIVGGIDARPNEFPWTVSLQNKKGKHWCGGSIINERWILTSASCAVKMNAVTHVVVVGLHKKITEATGNSVVKHDIKQVFYHKKYRTVPYAYDIGIIKLKKTIQFNENITAVCAPETNATYEHFKAAVSGWGVLAEESTAKVDALKYVTLNTTTNEYCSQFRPGVKITDDMICTTDNKNNSERDTCKGDFGGPLVVKDKNGTFRLVGIVSWGSGCAENRQRVYSRVNYFEDWIHDFLEVPPPPVWNANGTCGKSKYPDAGDYFLPAPTIVGGIEARPNEFPWQVILQSKQGLPFCGGSIINSKWIITAAHCLIGNDPKNYSVIAGLHRRLTEVNATTVKTYQIEQFVIHEKFRRDTVPYFYDIGLVKVTEDIKLDQNINAVCAPISDDEYIHVKAAVSGWGASETSEAVDGLRYTTVNTTTSEFCSKKYFELGNITDDMICASDNMNNTERDSCQRDSGGPLVVKDKNGIFRLIGIVSKNSRCANKYPGVYTRITFFEEWIRWKIKPKGTCGNSKYPDAGDYFLPAPSITGGIVARPNEFPWQVSIQLESGFQHCSGSIINERWILTAAHCVVDKEVRKYVIVVGLHKRYSESHAPTVKSYRIEKMIYHEKYDAKLYFNNIGLIKVTEDIKMDENVTSVCAPESNNEYIYTKAAVCGWGHLGPGNGTVVDALRYTTVNTTTNDKCAAAYTLNTIPYDMMCTSDNRNDTERGFCQGDSGSSLMVKDKNGTFRIIGIVSWVVKCVSTLPGAYTRVNYFEDWIMKNID